MATLETVINWDMYMYRKKSKKHVYCRVCHRHADLCCGWKAQNCNEPIMCAFEKELQG